MSTPKNNEGNSVLNDALNIIAAHEPVKFIDAQNACPLRVWWIPQVGVNAEPFYVPVKDIEQAKLIINTLADYDTYQFRYNIKPDYTNVGGLQVFEDGEWCDWESADGDDIDSLMMDDLAKAEEAVS